MNTKPNAGAASGADADLLELEDGLSATTLTAAEKACRIAAAKAAREDEDEDDDADLEEEDDAPTDDDDDNLDDDALDKEFEEFDLPKSNRGAGSSKNNDEDDEFRDLGIDTGRGGGFDDEEDDDF